MALYAMGDLHLAFSSDKTMEIYGENWKDYVNRIEENCRRLLKSEDTIVLCGDHSWGHRLADCEKDLRFIESLPGKKILLRGNHDMFWNDRKTPKLNEAYDGRLCFLQNNFYSYKDYALVGTKGICREDKIRQEQYERLLEREKKRLCRSFEAAREEGYRRYIMFLHYPPTSVGEDKSPFTETAEAYGAEQVIYAHCHGEACWHDSLLGPVRGINYRLVSSDFLQFVPEKILD